MSKKYKKVCTDWTVVSRVIPRDSCMESFGKLIVVWGPYTCNLYFNYYEN